MDVVAVIPARYGSTRFPGKPLADILGKPMIQRVYECAAGASRVTRTLVATDDERIKKAVEAFGGEALMTADTHASGSDRVAEVAKQIQGDIYVNLQGDEPLMESWAIDEAVERVAEGGDPMASLMAPIRSKKELQALSVVKVVVDAESRAIYFSRFPIPHSRAAAIPEKGDVVCRRHLGLYVYDRETLLKFSQLPVTELERAESLEQLRALSYGIRIGMVEVNLPHLGVDTPEDLDKVREHLVRQGTPHEEA